MRITRRAALLRLMIGLGFTLLISGPSRAKLRGETADRLRRLFGKSRSCLHLARRSDFRLGTEGSDSFETCIGFSSDYLTRMTDGALLARIQSNIKQDFEQGRIYLVDGWQVSATELAIIKSL